MLLRPQSSQMLSK